MLNMQTDKSSRLILHPAAWLICFLPCLSFLSFFLSLFSFPSVPPFLCLRVAVDKVTWRGKLFLLLSVFTLVVYQDLPLISLLSFQLMSAVIFLPFAFKHVLLRLNSVCYSVWGAKSTPSRLLLKVVFNHPVKRLPKNERGEGYELDRPLVRHLQCIIFTP